MKLTQAWGYPHRIIDGDTFVMLITSVSRDNEYPLGEVENVRLRRVNAPELGRPGAARATQRLERRIEGRRIRIDVYARDGFGRLLATVSPAQR